MEALIKMNNGMWLEVELISGKAVIYFGQGGVIAIELCKRGEQQGSILRTAGEGYYNCVMSPQLIFAMIKDYNR